MRWIMDVVQYARDKQIKGGVPLSVLCAPPPSPVETPQDSLFITNDRIPGDRIGGKGEIFVLCLIFIFSGAYLFDLKGICSHLV